MHSVGEARVNVGGRRAVQRFRGFAAVVEADDGYVDGGGAGFLRFPLQIVVGGEDVAGFLDAFQSAAVATEAYRLSGEQAGAPA